MAPIRRAWAWGRIRPLTMRHSLGAAPPAGSGLQPGAGALWRGHLHGQPGRRPTSTTRPGGVLANASLRMVIDVGAWDNSRYVLPGGQSGNPLSPHYDDQLQLWLRGEGVPIAWSEAAVEAATRKVLRLEPGAGDG